MPIYEYHCRQCASKFELIVLPASPTPACPACRSEDIRQLLSAFAVSSGAIRESNIQSARAKHANSSRVRDEKVAEVEYIRKEKAEHGPE